MAYKASIEWAMIANIENPATTSWLFFPNVFTKSPNGMDEGIEFGANHAKNTRYNPYATGIAIKEQKYKYILVYTYFWIRMNNKWLNGHYLSMNFEILIHRSQNIK